VATAGAETTEPDSQLRGGQGTHSDLQRVKPIFEGRGGQDDTRVGGRMFVAWLGRARVGLFLPMRLASDSKGPGHGGGEHRGTGDLGA